jgi:hypothetical protein
MLASALALVPGTGPIDRKLGKLVGLNVFRILLDASFHSPENAHSLIIGGLAFIYHAKPRYTKDMALWIDPSRDNVKRANAALSDFGSPHLLNPDADEEILQLGMAPPFA